MEYLLLLVVFFFQDLPKSMEEARKIPQAAREGKLKAGDIAPDFDLRLLKSDERVKLSAWRGKKPVALVFGSYT